VVHILDVMTAKPGSLDEVRGLVHERYLPGAQARGMRLVGAWVAPSAAAQRAEGEPPPNVHRRPDGAASLGSGS